MCIVALSLFSGQAMARLNFHLLPVDNNGAKCDTSLSYESLNANELRDLNRRGMASRFVRQSNGYEIGYVFAIANYDAELAMGVYSSAGEHAGSNAMGDFLVKSEIVGDSESNPMTVDYEQQVNWPYTNGQYRVENTFSRDQNGYFTHTKLLGSSDAGFSPRWSDGYFRIVSRGNGIFVVACNYMVPRTGAFQGVFNGMAHDRLLASGRNLLRWVDRVSQNSSVAQTYRERLAKLVH